MVFHLNGKNSWSIIAGVCVLGLAAISLLVSPLDLIYWQRRILVIAVVGFLGIVVQGFIQSREDDQRSSKERQRDERDSETSALLRKLVGERFGTEKSIPLSASEIAEVTRKETHTDVEMTVEDPRIYLDIGLPKEGFFQRTPFILHNQGKTTAHNVAIQSFKLKRKNVVFPDVAAIAVDDRAEVLPSVEDASQMQKHDIFHWLIQDWDGNGTLTDEWPIEIAVRYSDPLGKRHFEAKMTLLFHPIKHIMYRRTSESSSPPFISKDPTWEFKNIRFALAS